jgi:hypothetical protein
MGTPILYLFAALGAVGLGLLAYGLLRSNVALAITGGSLLVSALATWILGPLGAFVGFLVVPFGWRGRRDRG